MQIKVPDYGLPNFLTVRDVINGSFRPVATKYIGENKNVSEDAHSEYLEVQDADLSCKHVVTLMNRNTSYYVHRPIDMHPCWWNLNKVSSDVDWYNSDDNRYVKFVDWNNEVHFFPAAISIVMPKEKGLSWVTYSGYSHDKKLEKAYLKAIYELIERDDFAAWWHKSLNIYLVDDWYSPLISEMMAYIQEGKKRRCQLFQIPNEWGLYTIMCIIESSIFPQISIGLGTNSIKESAIIHAIDECVGSYKGLLFESFHGRINYSELNSRAVAKHIIKTKVSTTFSNSISNLNLEELMKNTETFFAIINSQCGHTVKAFSTKLQPETLVDTTPLTSRLLLRTNRPLIKGCMPFW